jgi:hypothetical protein
VSDGYLINLHLWKIEQDDLLAQLEHRRGGSVFASAKEAGGLRRANMSPPVF